MVGGPAPGEQATAAGRGWCAAGVGSLVGPVAEAGGDASCGVADEGKRGGPARDEAKAGRPARRTAGGARWCCAGTGHSAKWRLAEAMRT